MRLLVRGRLVRDPLQRNAHRRPDAMIHTCLAPSPMALGRTVVLHLSGRIAPVRCVSIRTCCRTSMPIDASPPNDSRPGNRSTMTRQSHFVGLGGLDRPLRRATTVSSFSIERELSSRRSLLFRARQSAFEPNRPLSAFVVFVRRLPARLPSRPALSVRLFVRVRVRCRAEEAEDAVAMEVGSHAFALGGTRVSAPTVERRRRTASF